MASTAIVVLLALTAWRVTHLLVYDDLPLVKAPREWISNRTKNTSVAWLGDLVICHWCVSVYVAAGLTTLTWWLRDDGLPAPLLVFGAVAAFAAWFSQLTMQKLYPPAAEIDTGKLIIEALKMPGWQSYALRALRDERGASGIIMQVLAQVHDPSEQLRIADQVRSAVDSQLAGESRHD
jgi:hypothetical protein